MSLVEILLALVIISVIAAMTIPALMNDMKESQYKTAFKKAYSVANSAYKLSVQENGSGFGNWTSNTALSYTKWNALKSQLDVIKECPYNSGAQGKCWATEGVGLLNHYIADCGRFSNISQGQNEAFVTKDGMFWMLYSYSDSAGTDSILVDVNGLKAPNDWGKDVYIFDLNDTDISLKIHRNLACYTNAKHNDGSAVTKEEMLKRLLD